MDFGAEFGAIQSGSAFRHPVVCLCHVGFRTLALLVYLFGGMFSSSFIGVFVSVVLLLSIDFWTVKNITGRILVRLPYIEFLLSTKFGGGGHKWSKQLRVWHPHVFRLLRLVCDGGTTSKKTANPPGSLRVANQPINRRTPSPWTRLRSGSFGSHWWQRLFCGWSSFWRRFSASSFSGSSWWPSDWLWAAQTC